MCNSASCTLQQSSPVVQSRPEVRFSADEVANKVVGHMLDAEGQAVQSGQLPTFDEQADDEEYAQLLHDLRQFTAE